MAPHRDEDWKAHISMNGADEDAVIYKVVELLATSRQIEMPDQ